MEELLAVIDFSFHLLEGTLMSILQRLKLVLLPSLAVAIVWFAQPAAADDIFWTNAAGGSFQDSGNWSAGVPTGTDVAVFDLDETYEVSFADDAIVQRADVKHGDVIWNLSGYSISNATNSEFHIGRSVGQDAKLTVAGGTMTANRVALGWEGGTGSIHFTDHAMLHAGNGMRIARHGQADVRFDNGAGANVFAFLVGGSTELEETGIADVVLSGPGTSVTASNMFMFNGALQVEAGARLNLTGISGGGDDHNPQLTVTGDGTTLQSTTWMSFGLEGPITTTVDDGALFETAKVTIESRVTKPSFLTIDAATWTASQVVEVQQGGIITITGNSLAELAGLLQIYPQGTVNLNGGTLRVSSFDNQGTFNWNSGTFEITGSLGLVVGGSGGPDLWEVESGQTLAVSQKLQVAEGGTLQVAAGGAVTATEIVLEGGTLAGVGQTAGLLTNNGRIEPGFSPGLLSHDGDFAQLADGLLHIELAGLDSFDALAITGAAELDGTLAVSLLAGYQPQLGDSFEILTAASLTGAFSELDLPTLPGDWRWSLDYAPDGVTLVVAAVPEPLSVLYAVGALLALTVLRRRRA